MRGHCRCSLLGDPLVQFGGRDHALVVQKLLVGVEPFLVIARLKIELRWHVLDRRALLRRRVHTRYLASDGDAMHPAFPWGVEGWLVRLDGNGAEPVHAAHIMDSVHVLAPILSRRRSRDLVSRL